LSVWQVVNYNSALQHHPRITDTSDAEDEESVHVSTVISHVSQQFRFLVFFIVTQWVVSVQWNYFYELEYLSLIVVQVSLIEFKKCRKI
ncbi:hypothetical protein T05_13293, partial [Trichinella murrelli]